jgi:hypothetical protein
MEDYDKTSAPTLKKKFILNNKDNKDIQSDEINNEEKNKKDLMIVFDVAENKEKELILPDDFNISNDSLVEPSKKSILNLSSHPNNLSHPSNENDDCVDNAASVSENSSISHKNISFQKKVITSSNLFRPASEVSPNEKSDCLDTVLNSTDSSHLWSSNDKVMMSEKISKSISPKSSSSPYITVSPDSNTSSSLSPHYGGDSKSLHSLTNPSFTSIDKSEFHINPISLTLPSLEHHHCWFFIFRFFVN